MSPYSVKINWSLAIAVCTVWCDGSSSEGVFQQLVNDVISLSMPISLEGDSTSLVTCQGHVTLTWLGQEIL